jgi:hypothetical protein
MGCYVSGLYLEGAAWDHQAGKLKRQPPRQTVDELPVLQVRITVAALRVEFHLLHRSSSRACCRRYKHTQQNAWPIYVNV